MSKSTKTLFKINNAELQIDIVLVDYIYPVLFTCTDRTGRMYIVVCYFADGARKEWLIADTTAEKVISLLQDKVTIRDMFINTPLWQAVQESNKAIPAVKRVTVAEIAPNVLPTEGEFMDADPEEFEEEIRTLSRRVGDIYGSPIQLDKKVYISGCYSFFLHNLLPINMNYGTAKEVVSHVPAY